MDFGRLFLRMIGLVLRIIGFGFSVWILINQLDDLKIQLYTILARVESLDLNIQLLPVRFV
ncbi:MAG: hypothetical protein C5B59_04560 [Bacteroidetes bacterium]|nr:MAG: hypothetical protein C5B59_04560 [Bacteroidota bacterium]